MNYVIRSQTYVICPKHGKHVHILRSTIPGHEGAWCNICWLESLGPPLPTTTGPWNLEGENPLVTSEVALGTGA